MDMAARVVYNTEKRTFVLICVDAQAIIWYNTYMGKDIDFTVKNELTYGRGYVYNGTNRCLYHYMCGGIREQDCAGQALL